MARYDNNGDRNNGNGFNPGATPVSTGVKRDFRADLEDLVFADSIIERTNPHMEKLEEKYVEYDEFLVEKLTTVFKMTEADARALGDIDKKIAYMGKNIWKLKVPQKAPLQEEATIFGKGLREVEEDVRTELNEVLAQQAKITARNDELLKVYHEQLMEDTKRAEDLEVENAGLLDTIPDIVDKPLYDEVKSLKEAIDKKYEEIDELRKKIEAKENENITLENEIDELDDKIRNETAEIAKLNRDKIEAEKKINTLNKELATARKNKDDKEIERLEKELESEKSNKDRLVAEINEKNSIVNGYRDERSKRVSSKNTKLREINTLNNEKRTIRASLEKDENDHKIKLANLTQERKEDNEQVRRFKRNLKEIEELKLSDRLDKYKEGVKNNSEFKRKIDENRRDIKDKFKEFKVAPPANVAPGRAAAVASGNAVNEGSAQAQPAAQAAQPAKAGAAAPASGSASTATTYADKSDAEYANNFYENLMNKHYSSLEMQLQLSGPGFSKFVNSCEYLSPKQRKNILPIIKERRLRLDSTQADQDVFDRVFGRGVYQLVFDSATRKPRDLKTLNEDEIRSLVNAADKYNEDLVKWDDDDIKVIESKFFDVLANSAVIDMYESGSTIKGRISNFIDGFKNRQKMQVLKELRGTMCKYHDEHADKFYTSRKGENDLIKALRGETYAKSQVDSQAKDIDNLLAPKGALQAQVEKGMKSR